MFWLSSQHIPLSRCEGPHRWVMLRETGLRLQPSISTLCSTVDAIERTPYIPIKKINKHTLPITVTESKQVRFSTQFQQKFANATRVSLCKSNLVEFGEHSKGDQMTPMYLRSIDIEMKSKIRQVCLQTSPI